MVDILNRTVKTPAGPAPVVPVMIIGLGAYLTWFAVRYWRTDTAWPSDPIKAVLTGKPLPVPDRSADEAAIKGIVASSSTGTAAGQIAGDLAGSAATAITGGTLTKDEIKLLWTQNGGSPGTAAVAAAVAMAESSGRTGVTSPNPVDGGTNVGLWQLDTRGVGAGHTVAQLQDATTNARITIMGSANGTNWSHWEGYTSGRYRKYL
jgi:hypothetical protein